ncbi:hypothetical protein ACFWZ2_38870, partial [Streptomyces sp. NPDC059002]
MAPVTSLTASVHQRLADALSAALPEAGSADPLLRRSDRADFQANGILALAKKAKANPRELATQVGGGDDHRQLKSRQAEWARARDTLTVTRPT